MKTVQAFIALFGIAQASASGFRASAPELFKPRRQLPQVADEELLKVETCLPGLTCSNCWGKGTSCQPGGTCEKMCCSKRGRLIAEEVQLGFSTVSLKRYTCDSEDEAFSIESIPAPAPTAVVRESSTGSSCTSSSSEATSSASCLSDPAAAFAAMDEMIATVSGEKAYWLDESIKPILTSLKNLAAGDPAMQARLSEFKFCLSHVTGSELILPDDGHLRGCSEIPVDYNEQYTVITFEVPTEFMPTTCPGFTPTTATAATFCVVRTQCSVDTPTIGYSTNFEGLQCVESLQAPARSLLPADEASQITSSRELLGSSQAFTFALSGSRSLSKELNVWDGLKMVKVQLQGSMYDASSLILESKNIGLRNILRMKAIGNRLVAPMIESAKFAGGLGTQTAIPGLLNQLSINGEIAVAIEGNFEIDLDLGQLTQNLIPHLVLNLPKAIVFQSPKDIINGLQRGHYLFTTGAEGAAINLARTAKKLVRRLGATLDEIHGRRIQDEIIQNIRYTANDLTAIGIAVKDKVNHLLVRVPVNPAPGIQGLIQKVANANDYILEVECQFSAGEGELAFSCRVGSQFITAIKEKGAIILSKAKAFLDKTGDVVHAVLEKATNVIKECIKDLLHCPNDCNVFNKINFQEAANALRNIAGIKKQIVDWAVKSVALCGWKIVKGAACAAANITRNAICGLKCIFGWLPWIKTCHCENQCEIPSPCQ